MASVTILNLLYWFNAPVLWILPALLLCYRKRQIHPGVVSIVGRRVRSQGVHIRSYLLLLLPGGINRWEGKLSPPSLWSLSRVLLLTSSHPFVLIVVPEVCVNIALKNGTRVTSALRQFSCMLSRKYGIC
uniref:Uncharacterized protein n=1 Tax=Zea mays TaxID=4577 RepID=B4FJY8_MAIZE|nr:unknown [Zea mays]